MLSFKLFFLFCHKLVDFLSNESTLILNPLINYRIGIENMAHDGLVKNITDLVFENQ